MSFPGFYALQAAWLFLLILPLVVFYFLKLKRPRLEIPSLALWRSVINDQRVNSPFQRFKRNILLLLQLLILCCLVIAAMQPFVQSGPQRAKYLPVLIDCSASMAAVGEDDKKTRLDIAKKEARKLIDNLLPDQRMSLIAFHSTARRLTDFTDNKRVLHEALDKIEIIDVPSRIEDALRMTQALSRTVPLESVVMFTDGNVPSHVDFELPFELNFQPIPRGGPNMGITALNARRPGSDRWDVFVRIENSDLAQGAATVRVYQDGEENLVGEEHIVLDANEAQRLVFPLSAEVASNIEVQLVPENADSLESDNLAFLNLPAGRPLAVYANPDLSSYRHALRVIEGIALFPSDDGTGSAASYDLFFGDSNDESANNATVAFFVGVVPDDLKELIKVETGAMTVVDWQRSAQLLQHVQLTDLQSTDQPQSLGDVEAADYESLGYEILAHGRTGPLILKRRTGAKVAYYLLFHTDRSTLPYRVGFPILISNVVQIALQQAELSEVRADRTGVLPAKSLRANRKYEISGPNGYELEIESTSEAVISGVPAPQVGRYVVKSGSREVERIGVGLLDSSETALAATDEIQFREVSVAAAETIIESDRPLWSMFAILGFGVLLFEWWFFQRRPGGVPIR